MSDTTITIADYFTDATYGPYAMRNIVNAIITDAELGKILPGPMFYTYCNKGYIKTIAPKVIAREDAIAWTEEYVSKRVAKAAQSQPAKSLTDMVNALTQQ